MNHQFLAPLHFADSHQNNYVPGQIGNQIEIVRNLDEISQDADIVIIGCGEQRGEGSQKTSLAPDRIRSELYKMYMWHNDIKLADCGNIILGDQLNDSFSALTSELYELIVAGKKIIILGGSHDLTYSQYKAYQKAEQLINMTLLDSRIDIDEEESMTSSGFIMPMLTDHNNFIRHYTHIGFQSYLVNPQVLQTLDNLRFDCFRLGQVRQNLDSVEPELRSTNLLSIDLQVLRASEAPFLKNTSPNGLVSDELCQLVKYAAMNNNISSIGFYGWDGENDQNHIGAQTIAQAIWYFIDGVYAQQFELDLNDIEKFEQYQLAFTGNDILFLKSKRTGRWWMAIDHNQFIPCSEQDFIKASNKVVPERWLRAHERIV